MAPSGVSSKGKAKPGSKPSAPRSRNTTPLPAVRASVELSSPSSYFSKPLSSFLRKATLTVEDILNSGASHSQIPAGNKLVNLRDQIEKGILQHTETRVTQSEGLLRELHNMRKNRPRERDKDKDTDDRDRKKLKKVSKKRDEDHQRPPTTGAHAVTAQHGGDAGRDNSSAVSSPISQAPPSATGGDVANPPSPTASDVSHQPRPAPAVPQYQTFGPDPCKFDDPTIYHIRDVTPGMSDADRKEIYCVTGYPSTNLYDRIAGPPPDKDFSNAKPASQVNASVFANYVEPYIKPLTEEDVAFLKERGDRVQPFVLPRRGLRHYKEIWAEDDGGMHLDPNDSKLPPNFPRGAAEDITDDVLDSDQVSAGPLLSRLLAALRPEVRGNQTSNNEVNGDAMDIDEGAGALTDGNNPIPAAAQLPDLSRSGWKVPQANGRADYASLEERLNLELKHYGFLSDADAEERSYDSHFDDEVAQRLRFLQEELRKQSIINGARKQRLLELTQERIAQQEYNTIADDLDSQLNAAYLKRNRNIGKGKKNNKRPGGAGGGSHPVANAGMSRPGVGEPIRILMERRQTWISTIGPVVSFGKTGLPEKTVFDPERMKELENREVEIWNTEAEE